MKKIISTALALLMSVTSVCAAELKVVYDPNTRLYVISGNVPEANYNGLLSVTVTKDDIIGWASTLLVDTEGNFVDSFAFAPEAEGGYYTVAVGAYKDGVVKTASLFHVTTEQKNTALKAVSDATDAATLDKAILDNALYLGVDIDFYNSLGSAKNDVLNTILENDAYTEIDDFIVDLETAIAYALIKNSDENNITELMDEYEIYFNLSSSDIYSEFSKLDKKEVYVKMAGADCKTQEDVLKVFEASVALTLLNNTTQWNDFKKVLDTYIGYIGINTTYYDKCDKGELASVICDKAYNSSQELYDAIKNYYNKMKNNTGSGSGGSGKGSGGGSGGASSVGGGTYVPVVSASQKPETENNILYSDMSGFEWADAAVTELSKRGIISGDGTGRFNPGNNVTREQFVKMVIVAFDLYTENEESNFKDVDTNNWAYPYISCAFKKGIVNGISEGIFGYGLPVTRQDAAVIISVAGQITSVEGNKPVFNDMEAVADYAKESVLAMAQAGVINGYDDGCFKPTNKASRAEAAMMIYRVLNK